MTSIDGPAGGPAAGRFESGSHLCVRRRAGYRHHGIYINDDRVIQFGGRIKDKPVATIGPVSLAAFEDGGTAEVVVRGRPGLVLPPLPDAENGASVIERAEWLAANYSPGHYHLVGNNCENIANWCATGWYPESHQVRNGFAALAVAQLVAMVLGSDRQRATGKASRWMLVAGALSIVGFAAGVARNWHSKKFWDEYGVKWRAYDRARNSASEAEDSE